MRLLFVLVAVLASTPAFAVAPAACESDLLLRGIIKQVPDYLPPSAVDQRAKLESPLKFNGMGLYLTSHSAEVCIAVLIDEMGVPRDAAVFQPKRLALSAKERAELLELKFSPAEKGGMPVRSIVVVRWTVH